MILGQILEDLNLFVCLVRLSEILNVREEFHNLLHGS